MLVQKREYLRGRDLHDSCGQAENSILPGYVGMEASQAAFGDLCSWFRTLLMWPVQNIITKFSDLTEEQKEVLRIWNDLSTNEQETVMSMLRGLQK